MDYITKDINYNGYWFDLYLLILSSFNMIFAIIYCIYYYGYYQTELINNVKKIKIIQRSSNNQTNSIDISVNSELIYTVSTVLL